MESGIYILLFLKTTQGEKARSVECKEHEEKGRQRRPGGALKEEDKERKKKELLLKTIYSLQNKYSKK